jgi:hypothetical protein
MDQGATVLQLQSRYTRIYGPGDHCSPATVQVYSHLWTRGPLFSSYSPGILASMDQGTTVLQLQSRYTRIYRPGVQSSPATVQVYSHLWTRDHCSPATVQVYSHLWTRGPLFSSYSPGILASMDQGTTVLKLQSRYTRFLWTRGANNLKLQSRYIHIYGPEGHCSPATVQVYSHLWTRGPLFSSYSPGIFTSMDQKATVLQLQSRYTRIYGPGFQSSQATVKAVSHLWTRVST